MVPSDATRRREGADEFLTQDTRSSLRRVALKLGLFVNPSADSYREALAMVDAAERGGLDLIGIQDHPYQRRFLDTFTLIADLLARTERLRFFPDVANLPLRDPALMAKQAASLDLMSGGRFELGLGAGALWDRVATMGGARRSARAGAAAAAGGRGGARRGRASARPRRSRPAPPAPPPTEKKHSPSTAATT